MEYRELVISLQSRLKPLPKPEIEADKFVGVFPHLNQLQVRKILGIVISETEKSRKFDLFLNEELLLREEVFFLTFINTHGGIAAMKKTMDFDSAINTSSELMYNAFAKESEAYFKKFSSQKKLIGAKNRYDNHLEQVRNNLFHAIYNNQLV